MITVNGKKFASYDDAILYMEQEKRAQAEAEEKKKIDKIFKENLVSAIVRKESGNEILFFCFCPTNKKNEYVAASIEHYFGSKYRFTEDDVVTNYDVRLIDSLNDEIAEIARQIYDRNELFFDTTDVSFDTYPGVTRVASLNHLANKTRKEPSRDFEQLMKGFMETCFPFFS